MPGTRPGMTNVKLKQEADGPHRPQLLRIQDGAAFLNLETGIGALELVAIAADELPRRRLVAAVAEDGEVGGDQDQIALHAGDTYVGDQAPRVRRRIFGVT